MTNYLVVGRKPWNRDHFKEFLNDRDGEWQFCGSDGEFESARSDSRQFRYVFFLHWSTKVPDRFVMGTECVCFHMTDVPFGRGGSPLQNLISSGHRETVLTALRMNSELDAGPVYMKWPLSLEGSSAEEIYIRASQMACKMAAKIAIEQPSPTPQVGSGTVFKRRKPHESQLPEDATVQQIFDHIRMLDADGYPRAFIEHGELRMEFSRATLYNGEVHADVRISPRPPEIGE